MKCPNCQGTVYYKEIYIQNRKIELEFCIVCEWSTSKETEVGE